MHFINDIWDNMLDHIVYGTEFQRFHVKSNGKFTIKMGVVRYRLKIKNRY